MQIVGDGRANFHLPNQVNKSKIRKYIIADICKTEGNGVWEHMDSKSSRKSQSICKYQVVAVIQFNVCLPYWFNTPNIQLKRQHFLNSTIQMTLTSSQIPCKCAHLSFSSDSYTRMMLGKYAATRLCVFQLCMWGTMCVCLFLYWDLLNTISKLSIQRINRNRFEILMIAQSPFKRFVCIICGEQQTIWVLVSLSIFIPLYLLALYSLFLA